MSATTNLRMTAGEFIAWAMEQPEGKRYELVAGEVFAMSPERIGRSRGKFRVATRLAAAIDARHPLCEAFSDGVAVRIDADTVYEPDAMVRCGAPLDDEATEVTDPIIVVEVVSPSSHKCDSSSKLEDYFRIPSVRHYLIVKTENQAIIHHRRDDAGGITTHIIREGVLQLDPPGLTVTGLFAQSVKINRT